MVVKTDLNLLSVLDYAVNSLKVSHIIVCGHYGCCGVQSAMANCSDSVTVNWTRKINDVFRFKKAELESITDEKER